MISEAEEYAVDVLNHQSENHKVEVVLFAINGYHPSSFKKFLQAVNLLSVLKNMAEIDQGELSGEFFDSILSGYAWEICRTWSLGT